MLHTFVGAIQMLLLGAAVIYVFRTMFARRALLNELTGKVGYWRVFLGLKTDDLRFSPEARAHEARANRLNLIAVALAAAYALITSAADFLT
ncbi:hypothetical protein [Phenylobacterium sp.]|uniref:hypothetical protein n=1 Tax=Phenylobacterium sp. TaxID=1871053 RepID=UPI002B5F60D5|nr:hypothetical protein [Phenylobacterium sp.]HVI31862.1 hypothetical protein [Phenylobacterium sp.]